MISGVLNRDSQPVDDIEIPVNTSGEPQWYRTQLSDYADNAPYTQHQVLFDTKTIRTIYYARPGADNQWKTEDDVVAQYIDRQYRNDATQDERPFDTGLPNVGAVDKTLFFTGPGTDATWFTDDDEMQGYAQHPVQIGNVFNAVIYYADNGDDNNWLTADDVPSFYRQVIREDEQSRSRRAEFIDAGPDNTWFTADDIPMYYTLYVYDGNGGVSFEDYNNPGPDGVWFTEDDLFV